MKSYPDMAPSSPLPLPSFSKGVTASKVVRLLLLRHEKHDRRKGGEEHLDDVHVFNDHLDALADFDPALLLAASPTRISLRLFEISGSKIDTFQT